MYHQPVIPRIHTKAATGVIKTKYSYPENSSVQTALKKEKNAIHVIDLYPLICTQTINHIVMPVKKIQKGGGTVSLNGTVNTITLIPSGNWDLLEMFIYLFYLLSYS
jgi:hypothetical protein